MTVFIYGLYDPRTDELRYVGKTLNLKIRLFGHLKEKERTHKNNWIASLGRIGLKPIIKPLEVIENSNDLDWQDRERWWIRWAIESGHPITNIDAGGRSGMLKSDETKRKQSEAMKGFRLSPESIAKMVATKKANMTPERREHLRRINMGRKHSEETKARRSIALCGRPVSEETRRKIRDAQIGKFVSEDTRALIRAARSRQIITPETRMKLSKIAKGRAPSPQTISASVARCKGVPFDEAHKANLRAAKHRNRRACVLFGMPMDTPERVRAALFIASRVT